MEMFDGIWSNEINSILCHCSFSHKIFCNLQSWWLQWAHWQDFSFLTGHDFLALELVNGHVHLVFSLGERPFRVRDSNKMALNDNKWHVVTVSRPTSLQHTLLVDDTLTTVTSEGSSDTLDLQGFLYLGWCLTFLCFLEPNNDSLLAILYSSESNGLYWKMLMQQLKEQ